MSPLVDLAQTMQAPADCCDVSFLLETNHLEEKEDIRAKERFINQQKEQLETDRQKLLDFAAELAKQVSVDLTTSACELAGNFRKCNPYHLRNGKRQCSGFKVKMQ